MSDRIQFSVREYGTGVDFTITHTNAVTAQMCAYIFAASLIPYTFGAKVDMPTVRTQHVGNVLIVNVRTEYKPGLAAQIIKWAEDRDLYERAAQSAYELQTKHV